MQSFVQKAAIFSGVAVLFAAAFGGVAQAHVVVTPSEVPTASYQTFNVSVPNERDNATVKLKLAIPSGVENITPTVKPGWDISTTKNKDDSVKSITWKSGSIGEGLRDDFTFSAKTSSQPVELQWKAYQTYADGTVVAWDSAKNTSGHGGDSGPFSVTQVTDDQPQDQAGQNPNSVSNKSFVVAVIGLVVALLAVYLGTRKRK